MNSISEEKLKILLKNERSTCWAILVETALDLRRASTRMAWLVDLPFFNQFLILQATSAYLSLSASYEIQNFSKT